MIRSITLYADGNAVFESDFGEINLTWGSFEQNGRLCYQFIYPGDEVDDPILTTLIADLQLMDSQTFESLLVDLTLH